MAIKFTTTGNGLARTTGSFLSPASDFTFMYWVTFTGPRVSGNNRTASVLGDATFAAAAVTISSSNLSTEALSDNLILFSQNNVPTTTSTNPATQIQTIWAHIAVTYDATTHIASYYMNGNLFQAATAVDLSAATFAAERLGFDLTGVSPNLAFQYYRSFQAKLTATEIKAEMCSATAVHATPFCDTPLTGPADLTDVSGNNRTWTLVGTATLSDGPIIVSGIPNLTPATAIDLGALPVAYVENVRDTTTHDVWFKYTAVAGDTVIGLCNYGTFNTGYVPETYIYDGLDNANNGVYYIVFINGSNFNAPIQVPVFEGHTYYCQVHSHGGTAVTPAVLLYTGLKAPDEVVPIGSLAITDDGDGEFGLPLALLSASTGQPLKFKNLFPIANNTECLPNGTLLLSGDDVIDANEYLFMYDADLNLLFSRIAVPPMTNRGYLVTSNRSDTFYVGQAMSNTLAKVTTIDSVTGLPGATIWDIPITGFVFMGMAVSLDDTILYYTVGTNTDNAIKRWDLVNNIAMSDLTAAPVGYHTRPNISGGSCDILVLQDGNIVVPFVKNNHDGLVNTYTPAGALVSSLAIPNLLDRLTHALDDPNSYWVWIQEAFNFLGSYTQSGFSEYRNVKVSDVSTISTTGDLIPNYEFARYAPGGDTNAAFLPQITIAPTARFGASQSCPIWITRKAILPPVPPVPPPSISTVPRWELIRFDIKTREEERA